MIERDYILRMFKMLGQALSRILFFKEIKDYDKALAEIDNSAQTILGLNIDLIERIPIDGFKDVFGSDPVLLLSKLYTAGALLKEKGEILEIQEKEEDSVNLYMKSLVFFMDAIPLFEDFVDENKIREIDFVTNKLTEYEIPVALKKKMAIFYERTRRYNKLEDILFQIVEEDASFLKDGISFYERLLLKSDEDLEKGNLPKDEVENGINELQKKLSNLEENRG